MDISSQAQYAWNLMVGRILHKLGNGLHTAGWSFQMGSYQTGFTGHVIHFHWFYMSFPMKNECVWNWNWYSGLNIEKISARLDWSPPYQHSEAPKKTICLKSSFSERWKCLSSIGIHTYRACQEIPPVLNYQLILTSRRLRSRQVPLYCVFFIEANM